MPLFDYRAKGLNGQIVRGLVEAKDSDFAVKILEDSEMIPLSVRRRGSGILTSSVHIGRRVSAKQLVIFTRQLSVMVSATMPLVQAIKIIFKQTQSRELKVILSEIADEIEGGTRLSVCLAKYPDVFDNFYVNLIKSGETSGRLAEVLNYLADEKEKDYGITNKIRGAMIYPAFILSGLLVVGTIMMVFVVPKLTEVLKESGAELPLSTKILIQTSDFLSTFWWVVAIIIVAIVVAIRMSLKRPQGRFFWDNFILKVPAFGKLFQNIYLVRFTRNLQTLIIGKVPLTTSLKVTAEVVGNSVFRDLIGKTVKEVEDGNSISTIFLQSTVVPTMLSQMMVIGEQTGRLEEILDKLSSFYAREIDNTVANLVTLIEPVVMILMGVVVG
ncbi:type II secretion system F family protein, partial [Candidatus Uhrbacteria bacterium]|nr:type II secretion system F family protein [Candidatus Uhrbacteria bacterium]